MTWIEPKIINAQFCATINPGCVSPASESMPIMMPLNFSSVANVNIFRGSYTPNNDYLYIFQNLPVLNSPNFFIVIIDAQCNISRFYSSGATITQAISRFEFSSWVMDSSNYLESIYLEGRTTVATPMPQNVQVNYNIIVGQATIS